MRRQNPLSLKVKAPSRGLVTRFPGETADALATGNPQFNSLGQGNRASTVGSNVRYEDGVVRNAPGYDRVNLDITILDGIVAHWRMDEAAGSTRLDATLNHRNLTEQAGTAPDNLTVEQDTGKFGASALFSSVTPPVTASFFLADDDVVTGPAGDCGPAFTIGATVYITNGGDFWSSTDGVNWTDIGSVSVSPNAFATDGSLIVAAGSFFGGGQMSVSSNTGVSWTIHTIGSSSNMLAIIFAAGVFVTGGTNGDVAVSAAGVSWTRSTLGGGDAFLSLAFGAGLFVAVGEVGMIYTSPDGLTWTARTSGIGGNITSVVFNGTQFLAVANTTVLTSPDGITWTQGPDAPDSFLCVAFFDGIYIAGVVNVDAGPVVYTSPDGVTWTVVSGVTATASKNVTGILRLAADTYVATEGTHS